MRVIIVGGSIAGTACAHALLKIGCEVIVFERATSVTAAGAGLGLGERALDVLRGFGLAKELEAVSLPMGTEVNLLANPHGDPVELHRDELYKHRSLHWSDLHRMLVEALPPGTVHFGHTVTDIEQPGGDNVVSVTASIAAPRAAGGNGGDHSACEPRVQEFKGDLVVAADGQMSQTRQRHAPQGDARRYSRYCAWRGVVRDSEAPDEAAAARAAYPELGSALYFELSDARTHAVLYELPGQRLNWLWYVNQPEPPLKSHSVTVKADAGKIADMHARAAETFTPALAALMAATPEPFINAIFDREPLRRWAFGRCVLLGEAAHPTTPHGLRSTNMAIEDAGALAAQLASHPGDTDAALAAFQRARIPDTAREVLFSRHLGRVKQMLAPPASLADENRTDENPADEPGASANGAHSGAARGAAREEGGAGGPSSADTIGAAGRAACGVGEGWTGGWGEAGAAERHALGQANMARFPVPDQFRSC